MKRMIIAAVILATLLPSCMRFEDIKFVGIENVKIGSIGMNETNLQVNVVFNNPNRIGATLENAGGKAWIQNIYLGEFLSSTPIQIPARSNFSVPVNLKLNVKDLIGHSLSLVTKDSLTFKVDGAANLSKASFAKNFLIRFSEKRPTQELLSQIKF